MNKIFAIGEAAIMFCFLHLTDPEESYELISFYDQYVNNCNKHFSIKLKKIFKNKYGIDFYKFKIK